MTEYQTKCFKQMKFAVQEHNCNRMQRKPSWSIVHIATANIILRIADIRHISSYTMGMSGAVKRYLKLTLEHLYLNCVQCKKHYVMCCILLDIFLQITQKNATQLQLTTHQQLLSS